LLRFYTVEGGRLGELQASATGRFPDGLMWIDLLSPTDEEERQVQEALGIDIPTRDEVSEIQTSSRLIASDGTLYMSALVPHEHENAILDTLPVTFVRHADQLVTVRYGHPEAVDRLVERSRLGLVHLDDADSVLAALLEAIVDRVADRLEAVGLHLRRLESGVFRRGTVRTSSNTRRSLGQRIHALQEAIEKLGASHQTVVQLRESLASVARLVAFRRAHGAPDDRRLTIIDQDLRAIIEHSVDLTANMEFVLDATVGLIDVQQNKVIYILSIFSVVLTPPVLVASVYGMNFEHMPELAWLLGYPYALALMLVSAVVPFLAFKWKGWL
jgi:magnesium transporter